MTLSVMPPSILILADDFTGANDTGAQLVKKGASVNVLFDWQTLPDTTLLANDAIVISTDSRALSSTEAYQRTQTVIQYWPFDSLIYKKIDSTLRGNIGSEIEAILAEKEMIAIVAPAYPDMQRITINGNCIVDGIALIDTEFATDPKTPIYSSNIKACINNQTSLSCDEIHLSDLRSNFFVEKLEQQIAKGTKIIVIDAECNEDLARIAEINNQLNTSILWVGSAGLINELPLQYTKKAPFQPCEPSANPLLVIAGSMSQTTQKQILHTQYPASNWTIIDIDIKKILPNIDTELVKHYAQQAIEALSQNKHTIIRTSCDSNDRNCIDNYCAEYSFTRQQLGEHISHFLGLITLDITSNHTVCGLFLTGGDIAISVAKTLGAEGFRIEGEVSSGIPYGSLIGNTPSNYRVFTKAGGFGEHDIFIKTLKFI